MSELRFKTYSEIEEATVREQGDSQRAFDEFANQFTKCGPEQRLEILRNWEQVGEASTQPNRLNAMYMQRFRQLRAQHALLKKVGR
jgi:hypothetical protein